MSSLRHPLGRSRAIRLRASRRRAVTSVGALLILLFACEEGSTGPAEPSEPPRITRLDPLEGPVGTEVRISGEGFGTDPGVVEVTFEGEVAVVTGIDATSLRALVPEVEPGKAEVVVTVEGLASNPGIFRVRGAPSSGTSPS